jgi:vanillate/3-O-methylgallate O-demethylase
MAYSTFQCDSVLVNDAVAGISTRGGYNTNRRSFFSLAMVDEHIAHEGAEVVVTWGEANGGAAKPYLERHVPVAIRATVSRLF